MSKDTLSKAGSRLKKLLNQISGDVDPKQTLEPEYTIIGKGDIMCYDPAARVFKKINRGTTAYIIKENYDYKGRVLVYTLSGELVCIDPEELFLLENFD